MSGYQMQVPPTLVVDGLVLLVGLLLMVALTRDGGRQRTPLPA
jgi:hypothetical protein